MDVLSQLTLPASSSSKVRLWGRAPAWAMSTKWRPMIMSHSDRYAS